MIKVELKMDPKSTSIRTKQKGDKKKFVRKWRISIYPVAVNEEGDIVFDFGRIRSGLYNRQLDAQVAEKEFIRKKLKECKKMINPDDTADQLLDKFIESGENEWKPGTLTSYKDVIKNQIRPYLDDCTKEELEEKTKGFQNWLKNKTYSRNGKTSTFSVRRQNFIFSLYRSFLNYLFQNGLIKEDLTRYLGRKTIPKSKPRTTIVDTNYFKLLIQIAKEHGADENVWRMIVLALMTGCRRGELLGLLVEDYNSRMRTLQINKSFSRRGYEETKTASSNRTVAVPQYLAQVLDEMLEERRRGFSEYEFSKQPLFMKNGAPYPTSTFGRYLKEVFKVFEEETGEHLVFHDLRRTYSTIQYEISDGNHDYMKSVMGHSSIDTTKQIYTVVTEQRKKKNSQKFSDEMDEILS